MSHTTPFEAKGGLVLPIIISLCCVLLCEVTILNNSPALYRIWWRNLPFLILSFFPISSFFCKKNKTTTNQQIADKQNTMPKQPPLTQTIHHITPRQYSPEDKCTSSTTHTTLTPSLYCHDTLLCSAVSFLRQVCCAVWVHFPPFSPISPAPFVHLRFCNRFNSFILCVQLILFDWGSSINFYLPQHPPWLSSLCGTNHAIQ